MLGSHVFMFAMAASLYGCDWQTFARTMPGVFVPGQTGLGYWCNAYTTFYATLAMAASVHATGIFDLADLVKEYPAFLTTAIILGDIYSVMVHLVYARGWQLLSVYKFFMGIGVHPRIGLVDIKMVAETR